MSILSKSGRMHLVKHPWQIILTVIGVALGVAVVVSIDLANQSSARAFEMSMESVTGKATHHIIGGPKGVPDSVFKQIRVDLNINKSSPVMERYLYFDNNDSPRILSYLGIDPFSEKPFRENLSDVAGKVPGGLETFIAKQKGILISETLASLSGKSIGDIINLRNGAEYFNMPIIGILEADDASEQKAIENLVVTDISNAQDVLNMQGHLSRIDLIIDNEKVESIQDKLPRGIRIIRSESKNSATAQMTEAFKINLNAMSMLALIVGMFLIYNTMTFSVLQRKRYIGLLRSIGVTRKEIFKLILGEALILGIAGTVIGLLVGVLLGTEMIKLVSQTINDLYYVLNVNDYKISTFSILKGLALGIFATVVAAFKPADEATKTAPGIVSRRSNEEIKLNKNMPLMTIIGVVAIILGSLILLIPTRSIAISFAGILPIIIGFTLMTPLTIKVFTSVIQPILKALFGTIGKMAVRGVFSQMSRTSVAIAALAIAVAASIGVGTMVSSFRTTVVHWLETRLEADIYVSAPNLVSRKNDAVMTQEFSDKLDDIPGLKRKTDYRDVELIHKGKTIHIIAADIKTESSSSFLFKKGNPDEVFDKVVNSMSVMISEAYAYKNNVDVGDKLEIPTEKGLKYFEIAGIYYDYGSDMGLVTMYLGNYRKFFDDTYVSGISIFVKDGFSEEEFIEKIRQVAGPDMNIKAQSNSNLLNTSIKIFDRTFIITNVLQFLAIGVSFIGILSALMALQLEREKEYAIYRANGLTPKQLRFLVSGQTLIMGLIAGLIALPLGNILAVILIYIINKRSFGWTLQFELSPELLLQSLLISLLAAFLAGIYPAIKLSKIKPSMALREE